MKERTIWVTETRKYTLEIMPAFGQDVVIVRTPEGHNFIASDPGCFKEKPFSLLPEAVIEAAKQAFDPLGPDELIAPDGKGTVVKLSIDSHGDLVITKRGEKAPGFTHTRNEVLNNMWQAPKPSRHYWRKVLDWYDINKPLIGVIEVSEEWFLKVRLDALVRPQLNLGDRVKLEVVK